MELIFATNNPHKLEEIKALVPEGIKVAGLKESGFIWDIPEDFETLEENASQKAWYIFNKTGINCFADDTGLETDALGGAPGVYSARYSRMEPLQYPELPDNEANINKLLKELEGKENRTARFRTVISLIIDGKEHRFEGIVNGQILHAPTGKKGFGYDPVFQPEGYHLSFAEMNMEEKNLISHRARALNAMLVFLKKNRF